MSSAVSHTDADLELQIQAVRKQQASEKAMKRAANQRGSAEVVAGDRQICTRGDDGRVVCHHVWPSEPGTDPIDDKYRKGLAKASLQLFSSMSINGVYTCAIKNLVGFGKSWGSFVMMKDK